VKFITEHNLAFAICFCKKFACLIRLLSSAFFEFEIQFENDVQQQKKAANLVRNLPRKASSLYYLVLFKTGVAISSPFCLGNGGDSANGTN
jgi:hypothetical protein